MKTKIILSVMFIIFISSRLSYSQFITGYGAKAGATSSNVIFTYSQLGKVETDNHYGFSGSFFANFLDSKNFNLQANAGYDKRGYNDIIMRTDEFGNELGTYHMAWGLNYITVGVVARLKYPLGKITPYVLAGPNVDFFEGYSYSIPSFSPLLDNLNNPALDDFKKVNYSISLGAGIEFNKLFSYKTLIEFSYLPPINTSVSNAGLNVKEYSYNLKLGIYFNKDKPKEKAK